MNNLEEKIKSFSDFPTLPTIYNQILESLSSNDTTIRDISKLVSNDISLSLKILRIVNSSIYGLSIKINTVDKAIFHMGFRELKNIILTMQVIDIFSDLKNDDSFDIVAFWRHSIGVAVISRIIAQKIGQKNLDEFFLGGMIHDIGKLVIYQIIGKDYSKILNESVKKEVSLESLEEKQLKISHQEIGAKVLSNWDLDRKFINIARFHNSGITNDGFELTNAVVHISNLIAKLFEMGNSYNYSFNQINQEIWNHIDIKHFDKQNLLDVIRKAYNESLEILLI